MGLVHDEHVEVGQQALDLSREGEQRVVHDHQRRLGSLAARAHPEALARPPAGGDGACVRIGCDARAQPAEGVGVGGRKAVQVPL